MRDNYNETNISFCKLQILSNDENLVQAGHEALMETLHLHHFIETTCKGLQTTLSSEKHLFDMLFSKEIKFDSLSHEMKSFYQNQANDNTAEKKKLLDTFMEERSPLFSEAMEKRNVFRDLAKTYLLK